MAKTISIQDTITAHPTGIADDHAYASISNQTNGYNESSNTTYATINLTTGSGATTYIYYTFDFSEIPAEATIDSVSCTAKAYINSTNSSRVTTRQIQLYTGTTAKGSATTVTGSSNVLTMTPGTWTRDELQNARIRLYAVRGSSNTTSAYYFRFYGATFTVDYSVNGIAYTITASSSTNLATVTPATQDILSGEEGTIRIDTDSVNDITVTDNGTDITNQLITKAVETGGTVEAVPASYTTSGRISGSRYQSTVGHGVDNPSSQTGNDYCSSSGSTATIYYKFNFSDIPNNATITDMTVQAYGHLESTSNSSERAELNVYSGTTAKGTAVSYTSTSNAIKTISPGTWTVAELKDDPRVGFTIGYYGGLTTGITWTVTYTVPSSGHDYYYEYTISNIATDHVILIEEAGAFIPPEEDPQYNYYPITISSINAVTSPGTGTTRVQEGTSETITISPTDPQLTLALDNEVDITSQLVGGVPQNNYTITEKATGASYGFNLNSSTGYYVSTNGGVGSSASVARVNFDLESDVLVTIQYINQGESQADYGMFGKIDTTVSTTGNTYASSSASPDDPDNYYYMCAAAADSTTAVKTLTYSLSAGEHYIDIKYAKDQASDNGNDSLQWKILSVEATSAGGDYTYTLTNINQKHSLVFVFGNVEYYFINSSGNGAKLYPDGSFIKLAGEGYKIIIVPNNISATVTLTDNNQDKTSSLVREEGQDKSGNTVVNYIYEINNISAAHEIVVSCSTSGGPKIYLKINDTWRIYSKVYKKINGSWVEQSTSTWSTLFNTTANYVKKDS